MLHLAAAAILHSQTSDMQASLDQIRQKYSVVGIGCGVVTLTGRTSTWVSGVRMAGQPDAVKKEDTWLIGTGVQAMTGALVATEIQKGTLKWNQPIAKPLGLAKIDPAYSAVTIENLVKMTGGLDENPTKGWASYANSDLTKSRHTAAIDQLTSRPEKAAVGQFTYSNSSYVLLGHIVERLNDLALEDAMQRGIWYPLPLDAAAWGPNADNEPCGHDADGKSQPGQDDPVLLDGASRARMSMRNWGVFLREVMKSFTSSSTYVPAAYASELNAVPNGFCLGWTKTTRPWAKQPVLHNLWDNSYNCAEVWLDPVASVAYIAVSNQGGPKAKQACDDAIAAMIATPHS